jgi:hypothetical protein
MARKKKKAMGWRGQILLIGGFFTSVVFASISILLIVGMVPTIVCAIGDRSKGYMKTLTVGAINFAGCSPFMLEIFKKGNQIDTALQYIIEPRTIVVMYSAAAIGYLINWAMTGIVSSILVQKAKARLKAIAGEQKALAERWGEEVTGTIPLDEYGFRKDVQTLKPEEAS